MARHDNAHAGEAVMRLTFGMGLGGPKHRGVISVAPGTGGTASGSTRTLTGAKAGGMCLVGALRTDGQSISTPAGMNYSVPTGGVWDAGRILRTGRALKVAWCPITADGDFPIGAFTNANRVWAVEIMGVTGVRQAIGAADATASLAFPALAALEPRNHVFGITVRVATPHAKPTGATLADTNTFFDSPAATSGAIWTMGEQATHTPDPLAQAAVEWMSAALEFIAA